MKQVPSLVISIVILLASISCPGAESDFNVDVFWGWGINGCYRPMEWTPIEIGISNNQLSEPFAGSVTISASQDGLNTLNITRSIVLTPNLPLYLPLVTKLDYAVENCRISIVGKNGRTVWNHKFNLWDFSANKRALTVVNEDDMLIGLIGKRKFGLWPLPEKSRCNFQGNPGRVYVQDKLPNKSPWDWTGYASLDLLILYNPDWNDFNTYQYEAMAQWISNGGTVFLVLGSNPLPANNAFFQRIPFDLDSVKEVTIPDTILQDWQLPISKEQTITCWPLRPKPTAGQFQLEQTESDDTLFATGYVGFGRIGILAFDPATMTEDLQNHASSFWINRIKAVMGDEQASRKPSKILNFMFPGNKYDPSHSTGIPRRRIEPATNMEEDPDDMYSQYEYEIGLAQASSNAVMEHLFDIPEMQPLSIWWVILLLTALAVLLGPVDYLILKRLDRLPMTWITSTLWITFFTLIAYFGVQYLRGGKMQLRAVSLLDGIQDTDCSWSTTYCGLFTPYSADFQLEDLQGKQWWSGIAPVQHNIYAHHRQGGSRNIYCYQHDGGNLPYSLPINIYSMQCLLKEEPIKRVPFQAEAKHSDKEIILTIDNASDIPIQRGYILYGNHQSMAFGEILPRTQKEVRGYLAQNNAWQVNWKPQYDPWDHYQSRTFKNEMIFFAQGSLSRTRTIMEYLAEGAAVVCVEYKQASVPFSVKDRKCNYDHIQLVRLVVFPQSL